MAERRMFTKKVTDDDNFMSLSSSAQALYLHLSMSADDDGFSNQISVSMFKAHASVQDLQALIEKRYIYQFENGVIVINHWRLANTIRKDRYTATTFTEELSHLDIKPNGEYVWLPDGCQMVANWLPDGCQVVAKRLPQYSIEKNRVEENSIGESVFAPPTVDEIKAYCQERRNNVDAQHFFDYYSANGWKVGSNSMHDWKAAVRSWERNSYSEESDHNASYDLRAAEEEMRYTVPKLRSKKP